MDHPLASTAGLLLLSMLAGCSPQLNWREVQPPGSRLQALMPCKPEAAMRIVPLAGLPVEMHLSGCDAGGATFVIGWADVPVLRLGTAMGAWQDATLERIGIPPGPDAPAGRAFVPAGAVALPQALRWRAEGRAPDGSALPLQAAWFASTGDAAGAGAQVMFAAVYREPKQGEAADTFFAGLRLR
jgi:hypothetical protein